MALREELKNLMEFEGCDKVATPTGHTAYIGKATAEYSVPWTKIDPARKQELLDWAHNLGMSESVNAASFSAFIRMSVDEGVLNQTELPPEVKHYTQQKLNVREGKGG